MSLNPPQGASAPQAPTHGLAARGEPGIPEYLVLHADAELPPATSARLCRLAQAAIRSALGEPAAHVSALVGGGCGQVAILFAPERPALRGHELTALQIAWTRRLRRAFGPRTPHVTRALIEARRTEVALARAEWRQAHADRVAGASPAAAERLRAALNRMQVAHDALRRALARAEPVDFRRALHADWLALRVRLDGPAARLTRRTRARALRALLARAAALPDPGELRTRSRPTGDPAEFAVRLLFNFRNQPERREQHLAPESLRQSLLNGEPFPPLCVRDDAGGPPLSIGLHSITPAPGPDAGQQFWPNGRRRSQAEPDPCAA
jgi:hypothetical protein